MSEYGFGIGFFWITLVWFVPRGTSSELLDSFLLPNIFVFLTPVSFGPF